MTPLQRATAMADFAPDRIVAVASGKGGVGKTWFSVSLCQALALRRRKALLFDADMGLANVDVQIGLMPEQDVARAVVNGVPLAKVVEPALGGLFDVIAGQSGSGSLGRLTAAQLNALVIGLDALAPRYDHVVLDLGAGVEESVMRMAGAAARCIVLITDEPTSLTDGYAFIKVARTRFPQLGFDVVVNMADSPREGERTYATMRRACESFLKFAPPLLGIVRADRRVKEAIRRQTPLLTCHPDADAAHDVKAIAAALASQRAAAHG
ncbi:MAG: P-loop NTPase [Alphaproteobacteria bacterium]